MAFTTRSLRNTGGGGGGGGSLGRSAAGAKVGPGSYVGQDAYNITHAYAPFASTAERTLGEASKAGARAPGPGKYSSAHGGIAAEVRRRAASASNCFASGVRRFDGPGASLQQTLTPGPGTYAEGNAWLKGQRGDGAAQPARRVTFQRLPTAPSVPARNQSYGYEEGDGGDLIMQRPPVSGHAGTGSNAVGPTQYKPNFKALERTRQTNFGASKSSRSTVGGAKDSTPGPGAYTAPPSGAARAAVAAAEASGRSVSAAAAAALQPSSNFASRVPRLGGAGAGSAAAGGSEGEAVERDPGPGPGSYETLKAIKLQSAPAQYQFFGSTSRRAYDVDTPSLLSAPMQLKTPGPGHYAEKRTSFVPARMGPDAAPFTSTQLRFHGGGGGGKHAQAAPGPGAYSDTNAGGLATNLNKKLVGRNGVFGTTTDRFQFFYQGNDDAPGPGTYSKGAELSGETTIRHALARKPSSCFASGTSRFEGGGGGEGPGEAMTGAQGGAQGVQTAYGPPPGAYEMDDPWARVGRQRVPARHGERVFISTQPRFKGGGAGGRRRSAGETPGPGHYAEGSKSHLSRTQPPDLRRAARAGFSSNSGRFKSSNTITPGPGSYNDARPGLTLIKRSFNVTLASEN